MLATWKTADGKTHEQKVEVASRVPDIKNFTGSIVFKFTEDGVTIVPIHQALKDRNERLGKTTIP